MSGTLLDLVAHNARHRRDQVAFQFEAEALTFGQLADAAARFAAGLRHLDIGPGARVAVAYYEGLAAIVACYGAMWAGAHPVVASFATLPELERLVAVTEARLVVHGADAAAYAVRLRGAAALDVRSDEFARLLQLAPIAPVAATGGDVSAISFTAGTTGFPKAIVRTFDNDLWYGIQRVVAHRLSFGDAFLFKMPRNLSALLGGSRQTLLAASRHLTLPGFDIERLLATCEAERVTHLQLLADQWAQLLDHPLLDRADLASLRELAATAGQVPVAIRRQIQERFPGLPVTSVYGTTEAGMIAVLDANDDAADVANCVGVPVPSVQLRIVDNDGRDLPVETPGEIAVAGPAVARRYLDPEATLRAWRNGWFLTGDLGALDGAGRLFVFDRKADTFELDGAVIYPARVQDALYRLPGVREAAVIGAPGGLAAILVAGRGATIDLTAAANCVAEVTRCRPGRVRVLVVPELPRTSVGKLDRSALRRMVG